MRNSICTLLASLFASVALAQSTFTRMYQSATSYTFDLNELPSGGIFTCMGATHLLDSEAFIDYSSYYHGGGTNMTQTLRGFTENLFYFTTSTVPAQCSLANESLVHPVFGKMDSLGSVLSMRRYELNSGTCYNTAGGLEAMSDSGAILWGRDRSFYALRIDSGLNQVWSKRIYRSGGFKFIRELPGGDLLAGINMDTAGVVLARMNADGDFLWAKSYIRPRGIVHDALIESDSSFVIIGFTDSMETTGLFDPPPPPSFQPKLFMMKLNGDGDVQWCRGWKSPTNLWYTPFSGRIERTLDDKYVVLANLGEEQDHNKFRPFLMKTDMNGDAIWTRTVGREDYTYITQDLLPYSDGGFLISGIIYGEMPSSSSLKYIYKADSLGHFACWEWVHPVEVFDLFPVDSSFTLASQDVPTTVAPVFVNDSILDPSIFTTYDGCTFTTGFSSMQVRKGQGMRIRPNPNTGRFTVEFPDPLMADSYYSVYDAQGKLLYQRPLPAGATLEEVDLGRFGKGTYVIKFTEPDGACYERVVVE